MVCVPLCVRVSRVSRVCVPAPPVSFYRYQPQKNFSRRVVASRDVRLTATRRRVDAIPTRLDKMHPHPGFPVFTRLDDVCGACWEAPPPLVTEEKGLPQPQRPQLAASSLRRLAAIAAVALIATAVLRRRRG